VVCDQSVTLPSVGNEIDGVTITGQATGNRRAIQCSNANFKDLKILRNKLLSATAQWSVLVDAGTGATVEDNEAAAPYMIRGTGHSFNRNKLKGKLVRAAL
jgi:6-phosphogluconate dehydrogenase (decarboxylating)